MRRLRDLDDLALSLEETHQLLGKRIAEGKPFLLGRPGGTESVGLYFYSHNRLASLADNRKKYSRWFTRFVQIGPGVTHFSPEDLDYFCLRYLQATLDADHLAYGIFAPGALGIVREMAKSGTPISHFFDLEPLVALGRNVTPWTASLRDKRVLVVHPFEKTIRSQFARKESITGVSDLLPDFMLDVVKPPVTFAGELSSRPWRENFQDLVADVTSRSFDVAIIGAGSYGLPLAREIRRLGRQAVHLGGTTQLLFGIRGKRWESDEELARYFDSTWVRPSDSERPAGSELVEGGVYW